MFLRLCLTTLLTVALTASSYADTISANFESGNGTVQDVLPNESAGVVSALNWNNLNGNASLTPESLVDSVGNATGVTVEWNSANTWGGSANDIAGDEAMMNAWLDDGDGLSVTISGMPGVYDLYLYGTSDSGNDNSQIGWTVNGVEFLSVGTLTNLSANNDYFNGHVDGSTNEADPSYLWIGGLTGDVTITKIAGAGGQTGIRSSISGFQLVSIPEPTAGMFLGLGALGFVGVRRRN